MVTPVDVRCQLRTLLENRPYLMLPQPYSVRSFAQYCDHESRDIGWNVNTCIEGFGGAVTVPATLTRELSILFGRDPSTRAWSPPSNLTPHYHVHSQAERRRCGWGFRHADAPVARLWLQQIHKLFLTRIEKKSMRSNLPSSLPTQSSKLRRSPVLAQLAWHAWPPTQKGRGATQFGAW